MNQWREIEKKIDEQVYLVMHAEREMFHPLDT